MELTQEQCQGTSQDTGTPKLKINYLPDELLVEIFDFYQQSNVDNYQYGWFRLIHVCKRWRSVMFASPSRLDLCFALSHNKGGNMKTIMSRHLPPLPIDINYEYRYGQPITAEDMGCMLAALESPDRIRGITLKLSTADLNKFFKATKCPFPTLESLALLDQNYKRLKIPARFLKGSGLHLRSLKLQNVAFTSISRLLSSAPALTYLSLGIQRNGGPIPVVSLLLSDLQGMPHLCHLDLQIGSHVDNLVQPINPNEVFLLSNLSVFRYDGHSVYLNTLVAGFAAPSLRVVRHFAH